MNPMRWLPVAAAALLLAGCTQPAGNKTSGAPGAKGKFSAGVVTDAGGIDDQSFNASAWAGLKKAIDEGVVEGRYIESKEQSDYQTNLSSLAEQGYKLVFAVGYLMEDALKEVAGRHPETKFAIIDGSAPDLPNCVAVKFREEEGTFLAGFLAARMSKTGAVAFVGGMESPLMKRFEVGFRAGAETGKPGAKVLVKYIGSWVDVARGKELALAAIKDGADVLMHAAGKGGLGVLDAAAEKGLYGIGVDADQDGLHEGRILTSVMKRVDVAVYETTVNAAKGDWKAGERVLGLKENGLSLSPMRFTKSAVPAATLSAIDDLKARIAAGELKVPSTDAGLKGFVAPAVK
ncbi:MAG: BMP family ABC transporter substrate-binding protein [Armatimonadetes bacterium]|nr:BMP family ABC transporter substrate-binding protein [Armatimonadota bacterium]